MLRPQEISEDVEGGAPSLPSLSGEQPLLRGNKMFTPARVIAFLAGLQVGRIIERRDAIT